MSKLDLGYAEKRVYGHVSANDILANSTAWTCQACGEHPAKLCKDDDGRAYRECACTREYLKQLGEQTMTNERIIETLESHGIPYKLDGHKIMVTSKHFTDKAINMAGVSAWDLKIWLGY